MLKDGITISEITDLHTECIKLKEAISKAAQEQHFEIASILRDKEMEIFLKVNALVLEVQNIIKYADLHINART
jgi:protein-arginine kinase activator protein McsA